MTLLRAVTIGLALVLSTGALAQEGGVISELERVEALSPAEQVQFAAEASEEMRHAVKEISKVLDSVRRDGTPDQLSCLNQRLTAVRALLQVTEASEISMKEAMQSGETERAEREFRKIAVARSKIEELRAEADHCVSEAGSKSGSLQVTVKQDLDKPDDETQALAEDVDYGFDPPEASPFL
ncbi:MAG: hypothetical protein JXX28_13345 [Deltaproteobacteria bacterium]|nr:hypothetical protein [Deltaproteobacteria bacterium]